MPNCPQHFSRRLIEERATSRVGEVWRSFVCNNCGEVGVQRAGSTYIEWTGKEVRSDAKAERSVYKVPFASRQKGKVRRD